MSLNISNIVSSIDAGATIFDSLNKGSSKNYVDKKG